MPENHKDESAGRMEAMEARRKLLKQFGRYAAAAPAAMLLLEPYESQAAQRGKQPPRKKPRPGKAPAPSRGGYH